MAARAWYCWGLLLILAQCGVLMSTAVLHILYRNYSGALQSTVNRAPQAPPALKQIDTGSSALSRQWLWKYGVGFAKDQQKKDTYLLCPGALKKSQMDSLRAKIGNSHLVSLNRYMFPKVFEKYGLKPTHHWITERKEVSSGYCLEELKRAQKEFAKKATKEQKKSIVMKFSENYGECFTIQEEAIAAAKSEIHVIASKAVIKLLRSLKIPPMDPYLHDDNEWLTDHPLPFPFGGSSLLHGISILVSLTPQGSNIKLVGCSGFRKAKGKEKQDPEHIKAEAKKIREKVKILRTAGPGWEVLNCDRRSEYVKLGAMPAVTCGDGADSEYDLDNAPTWLNQLASPPNAPAAMDELDMASPGLDVNMSAHR